MSKAAPLVTSSCDTRPPRRNRLEVCHLPQVLIAVALLTLFSCKRAAGDVAGTLAEWIACPTNAIDCGHVYMCEAPADNELGHVEFCVDDDDHPEDLEALELEVGACELTPRHQGLCVYCCAGDCGRGANAKNGTYCPSRP